MTVTREMLQEVALSEAEYDQILELLGREPTPVELGMFGAMWSEHCGYKNSRPLLRYFPTTGPQVLQGPGENAGVVDIGDGLGAAFKVESHNHPSAVEPYQGAATGVGGIVRDIFTMGARPIALLDSLRFGPPTRERNKYLFSGVVAGIGGYGNCLGIPTVAGDIFFDDSFSGNPLVNAMCVGLVEHDALTRSSASGPGNLVIVVGADTGRDGIHGATFASVENPEESHRGVIQVGNPFLEKLLLEACLELLETGHVVAMQDLGAAGLTSSIVECASKGGVGIEIDVAHVSRREQGMNAYEVMLSESQERMLIVIREDGLEDVRSIFEQWDLHSDVIGKVTDDGNVRVLENGEMRADTPASYFVDECPTYVREGIESPAVVDLRTIDLDGFNDITADDLPETLMRMLGSVNIASREPVVRTYDHTIMSNTVIPPLEGDAAVLRIKGTGKGLAVKTDCNSRYVYLDPYLGGKHAVAEAARNVSCTGARPIALTDCLNFGNPEEPEIYFQLEQSIRGMADAATVLDTPVISGNASLYNESGGQAILPTPTVGMVGLLEDVTVSVGLSAPAGSRLYLVGTTRATLGASEYLAVVHDTVAGRPPELDLAFERRVQEFVRGAIENRLVAAAHDTSEGGLLVAICEMLFSGEAGAQLSLQELLEDNDNRWDRTLFGEAASRVILAVSEPNVRRFQEYATTADIPVLEIGRVDGSDIVVTGGGSLPLSQARNAWRSGLVW